MNNTVLSAKNTFLEGLIMDFSPDNTSAQSLTSALNATLITFNGNEMALLNDMGNGRVETAYLPEGFIPVGTCEFGDIIYVVSYNPLTNKSLIGCFPSPERNISTEEIGNLEINLSSSDFQEFNLEGELTGVLKTSSCKKILFEKNLNPGDKYIIYNKNDGFNKNNNYVNYFTDYGNTSHIYGNFPKLIKVHVVAIEDSNKINFLDTTVKWYSSTNELDYIILNNLNEDTGKPDLDSYRNLVSSNYSIFLSKVSGKLALLIELEKITGFSCTTDIYTSSSDITTTVADNSIITGKKFDVYWNISWETINNNINPKYVVLTKSLWVGKEQKNYGRWFYYKKEGNEYKIDYSNNLEYSKLIYQDKYSSNNIISFRDAEGNLQTDYWYTQISRLYEPENYIEDYNKFLNESSYYAKEKLFIDSIKENDAYKDLNLNKLNITREDNGLPIISNNKNGSKGLYYINAHHLDNKGNYYTSLANGSYTKISEVEISDDIVNNYFKSSIYKKFHSFNIPTVQEFENTKLNLDISNLIYKYALTPAMPYGLLEEFTLEGYIDFSKIGSGEIKITNWRYYNTENISTLTLGLEIYPEPNKGVAEIVIDFYDNQGIAASYHISNKSSYSGLFTEYIPLNDITPNYKLNNIDSLGKDILHLGLKPNLNSDTNLVYKALDNIIYKVFKENDEFKYINNELLAISIQDTSNIYLNDAGILYSNIVYLAKIVIKYSSKNSLGEYNLNLSEFKLYYRWFWTNNIFNDYYYSNTDFDNILATLDLDIVAKYSSKPNWECVTVDYSREDIQISSNDNNYLNLSATVQCVNLDGKAETDGNIKSDITIGLLNTYNTFSLAKTVDGVDMLDKFTLKVILGKSYINNTPYEPEIKNTENNIYNIFKGIYPVYDTNPELDVRGFSDKYGYLNEDTISRTLFNKLGLDKGSGQELWDSTTSYNNYKNIYAIDFANKVSGVVLLGEYQYLDSLGNIVNLDKYRYTIKKLNLIYDTGIDMIFTGAHFSKYNKEALNKLTILLTLVPLVNSNDDLTKYGMFLSSGSAYFKELVTMGIGQTGAFLRCGLGQFSSTDGYFYNKNLINLYSFNAGKIAVTKNCSYDTKLWNYLFDSDLIKYFRDYFNYNIGIIAYSFYKKDSKNSFGLIRCSDGYSGNYINPVFKVSNTLALSGFDYNITSEDAQHILVGLVMKDINGEVHLLSDVLVTGPIKDLMSNTNGISLGLLYVNTTEKPSTIGNLILSTLSNIYILNTETALINIPTISNTIYLEDNNSNFLKDIIYELKCKDEHHNNVILIHGILLSSYIKEIKDLANITTEISDYNIDIKLNSILKNIPIAFNFSYIKPSTIEEDKSYTTAIRFSHSNTYTPIDGNFQKGQLYTIDYRDNNIKNISSKEVDIKPILYIDVLEDGLLLYDYYNTTIGLVDINSNFIIDESNNIKLRNTSFSNTDLKGILHLGYTNSTIGGITPERLSCYGLLN